MNGKTIDSDAMAGLFVAIRDRDMRQKRTIRCMAVLLIICAVIIGAMACEHDVMRSLADLGGVEVALK